MASPSKRRPRTKTIVVHQCSQEEYLKRVNTVLFGNGHPEDGIAFLVRQFIKDQGNMVQDIANIRNDLGELKGDYSRVKNSFERYKAEEKGYDEGVKHTKEKIGKTITEKRAEFLKYLQVISVLVAIVGGGFAIYFGFKKIDSKIDNLGVPVSVTRSGQIYALPDTVSIKMWNLNDTTNTSKDTIK